MTEIKKEFLENLAKNLHLAVFDQNESHIHFEAKDKICDSLLDNTIENFFKEKNFSLEKLTTGGFLFRKNREYAIVTVSNFSGRAPFTVAVSIQ